MEWVQNVDIHKLVKMQVRCSSDLCLAEVPLTPSSLFASCRRSMSLQTNSTNLPLSTRRKHLIMCQGRPYDGPWGAPVSRNELCMSSRVCTLMHAVVVLSTVRNLAWELVCIMTLSLAYCSSPWCGKCVHMSSALVCPGSLSMLMTWFVSPLSYSMLAKRGDQIPLICSGTAAMTVPWSADLWHQTPRRNALSFTTTNVG